MMPRPTVVKPPASPAAGAPPPPEPAPPSPARRPRTRQGFLIAGLVLLAWGLYDGLPRVWNRARAIHYQRQCWDYTPPEGELGGRATPPACWLEYVKAGHRKTGTADRVLFLHGLRSPGGTERLVGVFRAAGSYTFIGTYPNNPLWVAFGRETWGAGASVLRGREPGWPEPPDLAGSSVLPRGLPPDPIDELPAETYSPGRVDPADPSHFTFRYSVQGWEVRRSGRMTWCGGAGVIDGRLLDDGSVRMTFVRTAQYPPPDRNAP